jgi:hypothetical protein
MDGAPKMGNNGEITSAGANFPSLNLSLTCRECDRIYGLPIDLQRDPEREVRQWSIS